MVLAALATAATGATPLLLAAIGETVAERSGVLNLGLEGTMLVSAFAAFATEIGTGSHGLAVLAGAAAGVALSVLFAVLALGLAANQVASGLAVTIFGSGLSSLLGARFVGRTARPLPHLHLFLSDIPVLGPLLFRYHALVYVSVAATALVAWALGRTRAGLVLRAVGEDAQSAHALGHNVLLVRTGAVLFGGMMSGLAGACLSAGRNADVDGGAERRPGLDCARLGGVRRVAAVARAGGRLSVRGHMRCCNCICRARASLPCRRRCWR